MRIWLTINEKRQELSIEPGERLLDTLRDAGYFGAKRGCEEGTCGSCTVLVDDVPHASCLLFTAAQEGRHITTIESLDRGEELHPIIASFVDNGAVQCGYCTPGMVLSTKALLERHPPPTEDQIREALDGHLCRCTGYVKQIAAVQHAAERLAAEEER